MKEGILKTVFPACIVVAALFACGNGAMGTTITIGSDTVLPGGTVDIAVTAGAGGFAGVGSTSFEIHYPTEYLNATGITSGGVLSNFISNINDNQGKITAGSITMSGDNVGEGAVFFTISFNIAADAPGDVVPLSLIFANFTDTSLPIPNALPVDMVDGSITVIGNPATTTTVTTTSSTTTTTTKNGTTTTTCPTWYRDSDGDGFGNAGDSTTSCAPLPGYVRNKLDCDDNDPYIHPRAKEECNGIDDNCNGKIDEGHSTPRMEIIPRSCVFRVNKGETKCRELKMLKIRERDTSTLSWQVEKDCAWLTVEPASGNLSAKKDSLSVCVDTTGLEVGERYACRLNVRDTSNPCADAVGIRIVVLVKEAIQ